ncbi:MAG: CCA tRNA nucleotidyltransferase [Bdellovibrionales bacterium]
MSENSPEFLNSAPVQKLFALLDTEEVSMLRIVGGAVRNFLLGYQVKDIDFATVWTPHQVMERCKASGVRFVETGVDHGTVTIVLDGQGFEITTLRKDVETDGRHAVVSFTTSWEEDARRRDFTMNALYMGRDGVVVDPLEQGRSDLDKRLVRFVGRASKRIEEDALRILRFYRFSLFYGQEAIDAEGGEACARHVALLSKLSKERVTSELLNICSFECEDHDAEKRLGGMARVMNDNNVFLTIFESKSDVSILDNLIKNQRKYSLENALARLYCFASCDYERLRSCLILSKKQLYFMEHLSQALTQKSMPVREMVYRYGAEVVQQALLFRPDILEEDIDCAKCWEAPEFPVSGKDLLKLGVQAGVEMGAILKSVEQWWIENDFQPTKDQCLLQVKPILLQGA